MKLLLILLKLMKSKVLETQHRVKSGIAVALPLEPYLSSDGEIGSRLVVSAVSDLSTGAWYILQ